MPAVYRIDTSIPMIFSRAHGEITEADVLDHARRLSADADFQPGYNQLVDLLDITKIILSVADMHVIARRTAIFNEQSRRAIIARKDAVYGMARMYQMLRDEGPEEIMVFRDMPDARRWLGLA